MHTFHINTIIKPEPGKLIWVKIEVEVKTEEEGSGIDMIDLIGL